MIVHLGLGLKEVLAINQQMEGLLMKHRMKKGFMFTMVLILTLIMGACSQSGNFPKKEISIIVPYSAGGGTDAVARAVADAAKDHLGQSVVVVNKTGAGGAVGMGEGANAKPDGYTVTMITVELTTLPPQNLASFTSDDFIPIIQVNAEPAAITVKADAPWNTVEEFINYAKAHPGEVSVGNSGVGAIWHLAAAAVEKTAGIEFKHVPYEGAAPAVTALLGGHIEAVTVSPAEVASQVNAGELKMLGVVSDERSKTFPDVPTLKESGYDVAVETWRGLAVPKGTPEEVVDTLTDAFTKAVNEESFKEFMTKSGLTIAVLDGEGFSKVLDRDNQMFADLIEDLGLKQ